MQMRFPLPNLCKQKASRDRHLRALLRHRDRIFAPGENNIAADVGLSYLQSKISNFAANDIATLRLGHKHGIVCGQFGPVYRFWLT